MTAHVIYAPRFWKGNRLGCRQEKVLDSYQTCDEAQLVRLIQVGQPDEVEHAFQRLYEINDPKLRRHLVYKGLQEFEIDDVCSVVWERSLENIGKYVSKGVSYAAWLKRTGDYATLEMYRKRKQDRCHTQRIMDAFAEGAPDDWPDPLLNILDAEDEEEYERRRQELKGMLGRLIEQLPSDYQDVLEARHEMALSPKDSAEVLGWKPRKVYDTYYRAMSRLKVMLLEEYGVTDAG